MKLISILVIVCLAVLAWLVGSGALGREATALALGVVAGALAVAPVMLVIATGQRQERIVYRDRIVYRVAEPVEPEPERATSTALAVYAPQMEVQR